MTSSAGAGITRAMDDALLNGLLPEGLRDGLPPHAQARERVVRWLQDHFEASGYDLVAPPLVEFEAGLHGRVDAGQGDSSDAFRLLDPVSQKTLIVRSDITRQVARIASTRMSSQARPLRLSYTGSALRTRGTQLRPSRQVRQVGFELIGAKGLPAARELAQIIAAAFDGLDVPDLTFDLSFPGFIPALCADFHLTVEQSEQVKRALDDKDAAGLCDLPSGIAAVFLDLLKAIGSPTQVVAAIDALDLPASAKALWSKASALVDVFAEGVGAERLHVDPGEVHGFSYQAGWALSVFSSGIRGELGKGGAYVLTSGEDEEQAQGFTFYPDVFADHLKPAAQKQRVCVPSRAVQSDILALQEAGYVVLRAVLEGVDFVSQAEAMGCDVIFDSGTVKTLKPASASTP
ncbi:MAG: ATP phosphoribosyltransferase regulatory subunit [Pseudomonadota bacterium]